MKSSDAIDMVKKMGLKVDGLEYEAEEIWAKLDEMSVNNPIEYQQFLDQTLKNGNDSIGVTGVDDDDAISFRPNAGFSLKFFSIGGSDGLKVREVNEGKPCFINFVSHKGVNPSKTSQDKIATLADFMYSQDIEVPLFIGKIRDIIILEFKSIVLDIVFHPTVIDFAKSIGTKHQLATLVIDSVRSELNLILKNEWHEVTEKYTGGLGADKTTPALFFIDSKTSNTNTKNTSVNKEISIAALLEVKNQEQNNSSTISSSSNMPISEDTLKLNINPSKTKADGIKTVSSNIQSGFLLNNKGNKSKNEEISKPAVEQKQSPSLSSSSSSSVDTFNIISLHHNNTAGVSVGVGSKLVEEISSSDAVSSYNHGTSSSSSSSSKSGATSSSSSNSSNTSSSSSSSNSIDSNRSSSSSSRAVIIKAPAQGNTTVTIEDVQDAVIITISKLNENFQLKNSVIDISCTQIKIQFDHILDNNCQSNQYDVIIQTISPSSSSSSSSSNSSSSSSSHYSSLSSSSNSSSSTSSSSSSSCHYSFDTINTKAIYSKKKKQLQLTAIIINQFNK